MMRENSCIGTCFYIFPRIWRIIYQKNSTRMDRHGNVKPLLTNISCHPEDVKLAKSPKETYRKVNVLKSFLKCSYPQPFISLVQYFSFHNEIFWEMWTCMGSSADIEGTMVNAETQNVWVTQNDRLPHFSPITLLQGVRIGVPTSLISFLLTSIQRKS